MRLKINLASQPYEDARRFLIAWSSVIGVLALVLFVLTFGLVTNFRNFRERRANIDREQQVLQDLNAKQQQDLAILNRPDNKDVREKSQFINELIRRKEVSWTTIFTDLEQLMPSNLRVIGVAPRVQEDKIMIQMELAGDSRDRAAELARRMEKSNVFRDAQIVNETASAAPQPGQASSMRFQMIAEYVPGQKLNKPEQKTVDGGGGN
jgi:hypothetical protein